MASERLRIGAVYPAFWPATVYGGPVHSLAALVTAVADHGHDVTVLTSDGNGDARLDVPIGRPVDFHGARVVYLSRSQVAGRAYIRDLHKTMDREFRNVDVVHASSIWTYATWAAAGWAREHGVPYVISTRGNLIRWHARKNLKKRAALALGMRRRLADARSLHATSRLEADELSAWGFTNIDIIPNGIDLPAKLPSREDARRAWGAGDQLMVCTVGRIHPVKRIDLAIRAVARAQRKDVVLVVAGTGPKAIVDDLHALAIREGIGDRCRFVGHVTGDKKWSLLRASDLFIQTSTFESFGVAIGEALGLCTPALITEHCSWEDIQARGVGRRVPDQDLVGALDDLLSDPPQLAKMGEAGAAWVRTDFGWDAVARAMARLYERGAQ